jgi:hypothetical protein
MTLRKTRDEALMKADKNDAALIGALSGLAQRMENLALRLAERGFQAPRELSSLHLTYLGSPLREGAPTIDNCQPL